MLCTLTYVKNTNEVSKMGKPYVKCVLKTLEHGAAWINGFGSPETWNWKIGDQVEIEVTDSVWNGKVSKKFKVSQGQQGQLAQQYTAQQPIGHIPNEMLVQEIKKLHVFCKAMDKRLLAIEHPAPLQPTLEQNFENMGVPTDQPWEGPTV